MGIVKVSLNEIIKQMNTNKKAQMVFVTNISGKDVDWDMIFQFNLKNEDPFFLEIKHRQAKLSEGTNNNAEIVMSGEAEAIVRICEGKGDFTHAISREHITVEKGKVMDVIRLTRAITVALKSK
ncbi:MAG: SCP2 sterol-binding domain-containing protein [Promethearchaeota archaeon]